ncbi:diguanylate cyclase [Rhodoferax sp. 4810]|nr:diguanylate cyclase [Rhodoferax jenense]
MSLLAVLTLVALRWDSEQKVLQLEQVEARGDLRRLLATLQARTLEVNGNLRSWANWTELYDHLADPTPQFRQDELSTKVLAVADIDFILLLDLSGQVIDMAEVPGAQGETPATNVSVSHASVYPTVFRSVPNARGCGLTKAESRIALVCFSPVLNSEGKGSARGYIVMGRWVDDEMIKQVSDITGISFKMVDVATPPLDAIPQQLGDNLFVPESVNMQSNGDQLEVSYPITSLFGQKIANIQVTWPRKQAQLADKSYDTTQAVVVALIVACGLLLVLLLDLVVVRRLNRLRDELALIVDSNRWRGELTTSGHDELAALAGYIRELVTVVRHQVRELNLLSQTDSLTRLPNRRAFDQRLELILAQHGRQQVSAALILMDVDFFKKYNDTYGHPAGDVALQTIADCLRSCLRRELDMPARLGGEEFGVLLQGVTAEQAWAIAEQIRVALQSLAITHSASQPLQVMTMSLGVAVVTDKDNATTLYRRADEALYRAKELGRNRVAQAD